MKELLDSRAVHKVKEGGVKLLGDRKEVDYSKLPPLNIVVSQASASAIRAIEAAGGKIECRYHNALGLRALLKPESFLLKGRPIPSQALPTSRNDIEYYSKWEKRGYLATPPQLTATSARDGSDAGGDEIPLPSEGAGRVHEEATAQI